MGKNPPKSMEYASAYIAACSKHENSYNWFIRGAECEFQQPMVMSNGAVDEE
jgi:hypothetical protein